MDKYKSKYTALGKLQEGEIYSYDKIKGFSLIDPKDIVYRDVTVENLYSYKDAYEELLKEVKENKKRFQDILKLFKLDNEYDDIEMTISKFEKDVEYIQENKVYDYLKVDSNGYIVEHHKLKGKITDRVNVPNDIENECYKLVNGEIVLDQKKYERMWL